MGILELGLPVILAALNIGKWLFVGLALVVGAGIIGYFFPPLRRLAIELAIVFAFGTYLYGWGVLDERKLWHALEQEAADQANKRDDEQEGLAADDEKKRIVALELQHKQDQEQIDALRTSDASCHPISADQLR